LFRPKHRPETNNTTHRNQKMRKLLAGMRNFHILSWSGLWRRFGFISGVSSLFLESFSELSGPMGRFEGTTPLALVCFGVDGKLSLALTKVYVYIQHPDKL